jgi:dihydrofolate reductase
MRQIAAGLFISLDGVVEAPEKWTGPYFNDQVGQAVGAMMAQNDAMLLGRVTYEGFAAAWPAMEETAGEFGKKMNAMPKVVVSTTLTEATWTNTTIISGGNLAADVARMKEQYQGDILVAGSATLVHALTGLGLVDEYRLIVHPIVVGKGKRLFSEGNAGTNLELVESRKAGPDVLLLIYRPAKAEAE